MLDSLTIIDVFLLSSYLISAILSLLLGYLFINKYSRSNFYIHFFILTVLIFLLGCSQFVVSISPDGLLKNIFTRISSVFFYLFPAIFVHFIVKMTDYKEYHRNRVFYVSVFYFPAIFFIFLPLLSNVVTPYRLTERSLVAVRYIVPQYAITAFFLYIIAHYFYSSFFLLWYRRGNITKELKRKADIILLAVSVTFLLGFIPEVMFQKGGVQFLRFSVQAFFISLAVVALALYKFSLYVHIPDAFFKAIMEIMSDLLLVLDSSGRIIYSSQSTSQMLGYSTDELYQMEFKTLFREKDKPLFYKSNKPVFPYDRIVEYSRKNPIKNYDIELESRNGDVIPIDVTISPFIEDEFDRLYLLMIGRDLREVKSLIEQINSYKDELELKVKERTKELEEANKMLKETQATLIQSEKISAMGMLAGGVAHEVNTPLSGVLGYVELLISKIESGQLKDDWTFILEKLRVVRDCGYRCKAISEKFLEFSRKSGKQFSQVSMRQIIEDALLVTRNRIKYDIMLEKNYAFDLPLVYGNANELQQVFVNLIINSSDAIKGKGKITITTRAAGEDVIIEFSDDGEGIEEENIEKIFKPFFTTKPAGKGTGLGLSVTFGIIKKHMGKLDVRSRKGEGTTFTITLPVAEKGEKLLGKES
ncbi:MAG: PAS domain S-box protein [Candidatus Aureabacteria bacterium]|nr:PAS domain S-box protein [Candidatus Auribacterota bacterium]